MVSSGRRCPWFWDWMLPSSQQKTISGILYQFRDRIFYSLDEVNGNRQPGQRRIFLDLLKELWEGNTLYINFISLFRKPKGYILREILWFWNRSSWRLRLLGSHEITCSSHPLINRLSHDIRLEWKTILYWIVQRERYIERKREKGHWKNMHIIFSFDVRWKHYWFNLRLVTR